jgi:hypothetical protein
MPLLFKTWNEFFRSKAEAQEDGQYKTLTEGSFDPFNAVMRTGDTSTTGIFCAPQVSLQVTMTSLQLHDW